MDLTGLVNKILKSTARIDKGRKGLKTDGDEHQGRLYYEEGIAGASNAFHLACISHRTRLQNVLRPLESI